MILHNKAVKHTITINVMTVDIFFIAILNDCVYVMKVDIDFNFNFKEVIFYGYC